MKKTLYQQFTGFFDRIWHKLRPPRPSKVVGMGAIPQKEGVTFRVWAPHAQAVYVIGSFNRWSYTRHLMAPEANGRWSTHIKSAQVGDSYKYLIHYQGQCYIRTDPYARDVGHHLNGIVTHTDQFDWQGENMAHIPMNELVIYELHVGTFPEAEGTPPASFAGVIDKLPYLKELGINCIEIMPVKTFAGELSWGYNPAYPFAITRVYGGRDALKELIRACHRLQIAVIVDVVYNHFGPEDLSMWQFDGWRESDKGGIYFYNDWRSKTPWGDTRPDYGREEVRKFIRDNVFMWFEEFRVDGLRWDATSYIRNAHGHDGDAGADIAEGWALMQRINEEKNGRFSWKLNIAEDLQGNAWLTKHINEGGAGFDSQWDTNFVHPVRQAIITPNDDERDLTAVAHALTFQYGEDTFNRVIYTESHDEVANGKARVVEEICQRGDSLTQAKKRANLGATLLFTTPGIPMLFQGQEFLEDGWFKDNEFLDWSKATQHAGMVQLYHDLIVLRRNVSGHTAGLLGQYINIFHLNNIAKVMAFHRWQNGGAGDDVVVVLNFSAHTFHEYMIGVPRFGEWHIRFLSTQAIYATDFEHEGANFVTAVEMPTEKMPYQTAVALPAYTAMILSQNP